MIATAWSVSLSPIKIDELCFLAVAWTADKVGPLTFDMPGRLSTRRYFSMMVGTFAQCADGQFLRPTANVSEVSGALMPDTGLDYFSLFLRIMVGTTTQSEKRPMNAAPPSINSILFPSPCLMWGWIRVEDLTSQ